MGRRSASRVERRHTSREATRRREWEIWRRAGSSSTGGRERQATRRRRERQAARTSAAWRRDRHRRQVGRAGCTWGREGREGRVGARAHGWREGEAAWWWRRAGGTVDAWQGREAWRRDASGEGRREGHACRGEAAAAGLVLGQHRVVVGLALGGVGGGDGVND